MTPDAELVARANRGDIGAFGALVERYERSVVAVALAELRDIHAAQDVAQSTLLLAYRRLATLRDGSKFGPWLLQIARRQISDVRRTRSVTVGLPDQGEVTLIDSSQEAQRWSQHEDLLALVARLPDHERMIVGLRYFDGHGTAEIAEMTGRPLGTITKQLSRATARLRAWYGETLP